jgi:hypothetical protein
MHPGSRCLKLDVWECHRSNKPLEHKQPPLAFYTNTSSEKHDFESTWVLAGKVREAKERERKKMAMHMADQRQTEDIDSYWRKKKSSRASSNPIVFLLLLWLVLVWFS